MRAIASYLAQPSDKQQVIRINLISTGRFLADQPAVLLHRPAPIFEGLGPSRGGRCLRRYQA